MFSASAANMANSSNIQALIAAFAFGIVVNAATGTAFHYIKGHASSLLRDGLRLVLVAFLIASALWAQTDFITTLISVDSSSGCQIAIVFASIFDQLARVFLQQAMIWSINHHDRVSLAESYVAQGIILVRFILGGVFVGLQRPQLDSVCVTSTLAPGFGAFVFVMDLVFTIAVLARAISFGLFKDAKQGIAGSKQSRASLFTIVGFGVWTAMSVPLMLGIGSIDVIARTAVPAAGLSILIGVLTLFKDSLAPSKEKSTGPVENGMTRDSYATRQLHTRDISNASTARPPSQYQEVKTHAQTSFKSASKFTLPLISIPDAGQAGTGVGGLPVNGAFFPPMRAQTVPIRLDARRDIFRQKGARLKISVPVITQESEQKVRAKIPTVDLDTAVQNERDRVASGKIFAPAIRLASRTELQPPPIPPKAVNRKSQWSQISKDDASPAAGSHGMTKTLSTRDASVASCSSIMLSPALEELRRRSPRLPPFAPGSKTPRISSPLTPRSGSRFRRNESQPNSAQQSSTSLSSKPLPEDPPYCVANFSFPVDPCKSDLRPSRQDAGSTPRTTPALPPSLINSPAMTPSRMGLPTNHREVRNKLLEERSKRRSQEQTVMFMKNIEYNDPDTVRSVIESVKDSQSNKSASVISPRTVSVLDRPRPIPRLPEIDRAIFPAEDSPNMHQHKRSISSNLSKLNMRVVCLGGGRKLVPMPTPPRSAGLLSGQPGDTRSMTLNEKMELLYPGYGSARSSIASSQRRRSRSVPDVPILTMLLDERAESASPRSFTQRTEGSVRTSVATQSISRLLEDFPEPSAKLPRSAFLKVKPPRRKSLSKNSLDRRRSSPVLPAEDASIFSPFSEAKSRDDEVSTNSGSIHSPVMVLNVQKARAVDLPAVPKLDLAKTGSETATGAASPQGQNGTEEDEAAASVVHGTTPDGGAKSASENAQTVEISQGITGHGWHRRVGQLCPTFSERGSGGKSRKAPPPVPLVLRRTNKVSMAIQAEHSPLESPNHALAMIQEQLNKLERPNSGSTGKQERERMALLDNLETELGQQEMQWQGLRNTLMAADLHWSDESTTDADSLHESSRQSIATQAQQLGQTEKEADERVGDDHAHPPSSTTPCSYPTEGGISQQPPAQGQTSYVGDRAKLPDVDVESKSVSSISPKSEPLPKAPASQGSGESRSEYDDRAGNVQADPAKTLWCPLSTTGATVPGATRTFLWAPLAVKVAKVAALETASVVARRRIKKNLETLTIESSCLWEKPVSERRFSHNALWRRSVSHAPSNPKLETELAAKAPEPKPADRPATRRPPRRTKRVTLLPDILESPKPIGDRRGTLGIFQFPWGEATDMACLPCLPPRPVTMMAAGGMGGFGASSASFFEDYEAQEDGDYGYDISDSESSDSDLDETALWEMASLLNPGQERRSENSAEDPPHQRGEGSATGLPPDEATKPVRRDHLEEFWVTTTNFASSDIGQPRPGPEQESTAAPQQPHLGAITEKATTSTTPTGPRSSRSASDSASNSSSNSTSNSARSQAGPSLGSDPGPHATAAPRHTDQESPRRLHGIFLQGSLGSVESTSMDEANLYSATDAARALSPKAELIDDSDRHGGACGDDESVGMPVPRPCCRSQAGAPMTAAEGAHETGVPHARFHAPITSFSSHPQDPQDPNDDDHPQPARAWTLNSETPPRQVPVFAPSSRVLLPSAATSADSSAEGISIQTTPAAISAALSALHLQSHLSKSPQPLAKIAVPQHQNLLRNAHELSLLAGPMAMLWSPPNAPILRPSKGLSEPDAATWNSYKPIDIAARVVPRKAELAKLESSSLWTPPAPKKPEEPSHDGLWAVKRSRPVAAAVPGMWQKPVVVVPVSYGLSQPQADKWAAYLPAQDETPRVKQREAEPASIESQSLWIKPAKAAIVAEKIGSDDRSLWTSPKAKAVTSCLWVPSPAPMAESEPVGLFCLSHRRSDFRTSSLSPAALHMERKPRAPLEPFADFVFARLWNQASLWDATAAAAKAREQKEIDELVLEGLFSLKHRRNTFRTTSEPPAALVTKTQPRISQDVLPTLTSDRLWSVQTQAPAPVELDWLSISTTKSRSGSLASSTDEESASATLVSSVSSGYFSVTDSKPTRRADATPAQWLEALQEAIRASRMAPVVDDQGILTMDKDQALDSSDSPSSAYQLWSMHEDMTDLADESSSMWKPSSSLNNRYLVLTATPGEFDDAQLRASSGTLRRNSNSAAARPPPPVFHGSTHSAFLPAVSETPRDFSAQGLWAADIADMAALEDERIWLDKSLQGVPLAQRG